MGLLGNGEGHTVLILTDAESRQIRKVLGDHQDDPSHPIPHHYLDALSAFNRGVQRGTDRIKAEFDAEQKRRKASK